MNMIEKVARGLATAHGAQALNSYDAGSISTDYWNGLAKSAIETMREPTEEMIEPFLYTADAEYIKRCWTASIEAALKE